MKKLFLFFLITILSLNAFAQTPPTAGFDLSNYGVRIEPDKRLMIVLASLEAAGMETPLSEKGTEFRKKLQTDLQALNPELKQRMEQFIRQYKKRNPNDTPAELLAPFVSMAYTLTPVPDLSEPARSTDLPGSLLEVLDFAPLVREFYRRSGFAGKLDEYVKDYQKAGDEMRGSSVEMVQRILDYLHTRPQTSYIERVKVESQAGKKKTLQNTEVRERERRFFIVPELLAPKNTVNFRNIGDDYYAIVPPATDLSGSETRRAFLQFVFDPLVLKNAKEISGFREGIKALLDERRKENPNISPDVFLAVSRSLVASADAKEAEYRKTQIATAQARRRIDQLEKNEEKRKVAAELQKYKETLADETALQLSEAYKDGAVLSFYFARQLNGLTESGFDVAGSLRDMILSLEPAKEAERLTEFADARARAEKAREERAKTVEVILENPVTNRLLAIDEIIKAKNFAEAEKELKNLLRENPQETRIHYALGRVASLSAEGIANPELRDKKLDEAKEYYIKVVDPKSQTKDQTLLSLSYVALGRIFEFLGDTQYAIKIYEAGMRIGDVPGGAYREAAAARERLLKEQ